MLNCIGLRKRGYEAAACLRTEAALCWCKRITAARSFCTVVDLVLIGTAYWAAFLLKYDGVWAPGILRWHLTAFPIVLIIQMSVICALRFYNGAWRARGISDLSHLSLAAGIAALLAYVVSGIYDPPSSILAFFGIDGLLLQVLLLGGHSAYRILVHLVRRDRVTEGPQVLIYGAGRRGESILQELMENRGLGLHPIGFLDDDPHLNGSTINRVRILGSSRDLASILNSQKVSALIISSHKITAERLGPVMSLCSKQRIPVLRGEFQLDRVSAARVSATRGERYAPEPASTARVASR